MFGWLVDRLVDQVAQLVDRDGIALLGQSRIRPREGCREEVRLSGAIRNLVSVDCSLIDVIDIYVVIVVVVVIFRHRSRRRSRCLSRICRQL